MDSAVLTKACKLSFAFCVPALEHLSSRLSPESLVYTF